MDKLTKKQKGFVKDYIKTDNGTQSALNNYNTKDYSTAGNIASDNLKKPKIVKAIKSLAEQIPDSLLIEKHLELLRKEEVVTKNNVTTGEIDVVPTGEIDVQAVSKGLEMAYRLKGSYAPEKSVTLNLNEQTPEFLTKGKLFDSWFKNQQKTA